MRYNIIKYEYSYVLVFKHKAQIYIQIYYI